MRARIHTHTHTHTHTHVHATTVSESHCAALPPHDGKKRVSGSSLLLNAHRTLHNNVGLATSRREFVHRLHATPHCLKLSGLCASEVDAQRNFASCTTWNARRCDDSVSLSLSLSLSLYFSLSLSLSLVLLLTVVSFCCAD